MCAAQAGMHLQIHSQELQLGEAAPPGLRGTAAPRLESIIGAQCLQLPGLQVVMQVLLRVEIFHTVADLGVVGDVPFGHTHPHCFSTVLVRLQLLLCCSNLEVEDRVGDTSFMVDLACDGHAGCEQPARARARRGQLHKAAVRQHGAVVIAWLMTLPLLLLA